ncbi:MAG: hypothetical protein Q9225_005229 [Loekoesia sp. 1 TL-2023]
MSSAGLLTQRARSVLESFTIISDLLRHGNSAKKVETDAIQWLDQCGGFKVWAADTGACRTFQSSLDYKLRDDSQVRDEISSLLGTLEQKLGSARQILSSEADDMEEEPQDSFVDDDKPKMQRICDFVAATTQSLFQVALLVKPPRQADFLKSQEYQDAGALDLPIYHHLIIKFPKLSNELKDRLIGASRRQRNYLTYRARRSDQSIRASSPNTKLKQEHLMDWIGSATPAIYSSTDRRAVFSGLRIPRRPITEDKGSIFQCPYCFCVIKAKDIHSWAKHLFDDWKPYICVVDGCSSPTSVYSTRGEWHAHLQISHASMGFGTGQLHGGDCPMCDTQFESTTNEDIWVRHVSRHLQEIALSAIPAQDTLVEKHPVDEICDTSEDDSLTEEDDNQGSWQSASSPSSTVSEETYSVYSSEDRRTVSTKRTEYSASVASGTSYKTGPDIPATGSSRNQTISIFSEYNDKKPKKPEKPTPYICVFSGCPRQFSRSFDLDRHMKTHFPPSVDKLDCPKGAQGSFCKRVGDKGFTRKDHLEEHLRKVHLVDLPKSAQGSRAISTGTDPVPKKLDRPDCQRVPQEVFCEGREQPVREE